MPNEKGASRQFHVGQRVEIVGPEHPWCGETGHIVEPFRTASNRHTRLDWTVELDGSGDARSAQRVGVSKDEIRSRPLGI